MISHFLFEEHYILYTVPVVCWRGRNWRYLRKLDTVDLQWPKKAVENRGADEALVQEVLAPRDVRGGDETHFQGVLRDFERSKRTRTDEHKFKCGWECQQCRTRAHSDCREPNAQLKTNVKQLTRSLKTRILAWIWKPLAIIFFFISLLRL